MISDDFNEYKKMEAGNLITVEAVKDEDLEELAMLFEELSESKTNYEKMVENFNWMKANPDYVLLGAKYNGELAGTIMGIICRDMVGECKPFMVIENVIVKSSRRGKGIGKILMHKLEDIGRERDCYYTMFVSLMRRREAHKFYESVGYSFDVVQGFKKYL